MLHEELVPISDQHCVDEGFKSVAVWAIAAAALSRDLYA